MSGEEEIRLVEWGQFTEAVRQLQREFTELKTHLGKRCTDCGYPKSIADHENRLRFLEAKMFALGGAGAAVAMLIQHLIKH